MGEDEDTSTPFTLALIAGGCAGTTVDVALYPLDALKTRLQSPKGFWGAGGFSGIYRGVLATALGASPGSAMFFSACNVAVEIEPLLRPFLAANLVRLLLMRSFPCCARAQTRG